MCVEGPTVCTQPLLFPGATYIGAGSPGVEAELRLTHYLQQEVRVVGADIGYEAVCCRKLSCRCRWQWRNIDEVMLRNYIIHRIRVRKAMDVAEGGYIRTMYDDTTILPLICSLASEDIKQKDTNIMGKQGGSHLARISQKPRPRRRP